MWEVPVREAVAESGERGREGSRNLGFRRRGWGWMRVDRWRGYDT